MSTLPPLPPPEAEALHVHGADGRLPPMSRADLQARLDAGSVQRDDSFWFKGMSGWERISDHPVLLEGLVPAQETPDDRLDRMFGNLVKESWQYFEAHNFAAHIDEVFLGAVITTTLDNGYSLIDLNSDGTHHYLRFENLQDKSRIIYRLTHLTADLTRARTEGHRASVIIGYGERNNNFGKIMQAIKAEMKSGYIQSPEPGTITVDGDVNTGYVYVQVDLFLCIDDYVKPDYTVRYDVLDTHIDATLHALRKYLRGRFA